MKGLLPVVMVVMAGCQWVKPIDTGGPGGVAPARGFTVTDTAKGHQLELHWTNSESSGASYVRILRYLGTSCSDDADPSSYDYRHDLEVTGPGEPQTLVEQGLADGQPYCYAIFAKASGLFSTPLKATGTPTNTLPPAAVSGFTATPSSTTVVGLGVVDLSWSNPSDADFAEVILLARETTFPTSRTDTAAMLVYTGASETAAHVGAADGVEYFYRIWACDDAGNCSAPAEATATRSFTDDDGDGQTEDQGDCDDTNDQVYQGAPVQDCSDIDWDCDGERWDDEWCIENIPDSQCNESDPTCEPNVGCVWHFKPDFSACSIVSDPDFSYDICSSGLCISPGSCGNASCNTPGPHFTIPDTNQRECFDNSAVMVCTASPCNSDGSPEFCGQDAQHGWDTVNNASARFTRTEPVSGEPVVLDSITNLMWQGCPAGLSGSTCAAGSAIGPVWDSALAYCDALDWGGSMDWHLPDIYELSSIVDSSRSTPAIDLNVFPGTPAWGFWSSSSTAESSAYAWFVAFDGGRVNALGGKGGGYPYRVRCVRPGF